MTVLQFPKMHPGMQLTLDGQEIRHPAPTSARLGPHEREVLRTLGFGSLTSTQAGKICHAIRGHCGYGCPYGEWNTRGYHNSPYGGCNIYPTQHEGFEKTRYRGDGCCPYAVSEGTEVMKRLRKRGYVEKIGGLWYTTPTWGQTWKEAQ